jgi:hypothetical protein
MKNKDKTGDDTKPRIFYGSAVVNKVKLYEAINVKGLHVYGSVHHQ